MRDKLRIPHSAIHALTDGLPPQPWKPAREGLLTVKETARMLDMTEEEVLELVDAKKLSAIVLK